MNKKYYFKNFFAIFIIVIFLVYMETQYIVMIFFCLNAIFFPITKYALEKIYQNFVHEKLKRIPPGYRSALLRPIESFSFTISFFLAIPIAICFFIYSVVKND